MAKDLRITLLVFLLVMAVDASPLGRPVEALIQRGFDFSDPRPVQTVLLIGNSRTYFHDMPAMVRRMADSAHSTIRYSIITRAWAGATFEENWNDADLRSLLRRHWDYVILQPESRAPASDVTLRSFQTFGEDLIEAAQSTGSPAAMIVNWGYGESFFAGAPPGARAQFIATTEEAARSLASQTSVELIDTGAVWEEVHAASPNLELYEDGNHPSLAGSYLSALMIYGFISGRDVSKASYRPSGVDEPATKLIKTIVARHYGGA